MKIGMIVESCMYPIPANIDVIAKYGPTTIIVEENRFVSGDHFYLEGDEKDFLIWLENHGDFWVNAPGTSMMMQEFEAVYVHKEESEKDVICER